MAAAPWAPPPPTPLSTHPASVALWTAHTRAALPWLRAHDDGVRALPPLTPPEALTGVGMLVEPRDHADTEFVLRDWAHWAAPQGWGLLIVHSAGNEAFMRRVTAGWPNVGFIDCGKDDLPALEYQRLLTDAAFWRRLLPYARVMLLQTDTCQLRGGTLGRDSPFLAYDYVGAPWAHTCAVCAAPLVRRTPRDRGCGHMIDHAALLTLAPQLVGNGGLSLRNPVAMYEACLRFRLATTPVGGSSDAREVLPDVTNEDVFFCVALGKLGRSVAPRALAATFAVEQVPPLTLDPTTPPATGMHKAYAYLPPPIMRCILAAVAYVTPTSGAPFHPTSYA